MPQTSSFDLAIIGGGMVGSAAAVGLAQLGFKVCLIESHEPKAYEPNQPLDLRVSAINLASENLLRRLGVWDRLLQMRLMPYLGLETWELDGFKTVFHADQVSSSQQQFNYLGHIVENRLLQLALWQRFDELDNLTLISPAKVSELKKLDDEVALSLDTGIQINTKLLIAADGANSMVRQWAGIGVTGWQYAQSAMLINIQTSQPFDNITWQQFTPSGPRAFLPLADSTNQGDIDHNASLVWYDSHARIQQLMACSNAQLATQISTHFPSRLPGEFSVIDRGSFKLTRQHAQQYFADNVLLIGDAAHTINPLAGQGVNLGLKDVSALMDTLVLAKYNQQNFWHRDVLKKYQRQRYPDNLLMMSVMDALYAGFSNDFLPFKIVRNLGLKLADNSGQLKKQALKYAMGLN